MAGSERFRVAYVTSSEFKRQENEIFSGKCALRDGTRIDEVVEFRIRAVHIPERLEVNLEAMVREEARAAYGKIRVPCIVEHAGLIFADYLSDSYPGGLTKPMWNALGTRFLEETNSRGRRAVARAVVAYCDGKSVKTFVGETAGHLADAPRGSRTFYWDTIFIPDGGPGDKTYAEIAEDPALGLERKVLDWSQSTRAMLQFVEHVRASGRPELWQRA